MSNDETSRFVRLHVELVMEVADSDRLTGAALDHINADPSLPAEERGHARETVHNDPAEALAYLVDPFDLVEDVPGVELTQASWSSEEIDYDADAEWVLGDDAEDEGYPEDDEPEGAETADGVRVRF
ncbi:hypothetical protein ADK86_34745 [Streptomyces sp. NRRL F-5755]|uniref:hypothetical protein n=1 Tax=Streptomyces sp. NRRL F-5755 TaxID=1519475 RepID=UPI0006AF4E92|nr:hypothetical protein [Streptomyces sp. NRRL F-5755]KOT87813.1 hypothetical protein ADK86_34745 [Streptomyces sp. NRRL F-5755]KWT62427.1 hypothetical protein ADL21_08250 [Streptomyces albus subsp. albus]